MAKKKRKTFSSGGSVVSFYCCQCFEAALSWHSHNETLSEWICCFLSTRSCFLLLAFNRVFYYTLYLQGKFFKTSNSKQEPIERFVAFHFLCIIYKPLYMSSLDNILGSNCIRFYLIFLNNFIAEELLFRGLVEFHLKKNLILFKPLLFKLVICFFRSSVFRFFSNLFHQTSIRTTVF